MLQGCRYARRRYPDEKPHDKLDSMSTSKRDSLDLHGFRTGDVLEAVDKFMVAAAASSLKQVRIVTGKGTGAVQKSVIAYLKQAHYPWQYEKLSNGKNNEGVLVIKME